jgi:GNAT superfamily N-acetyltransferase
VGCCLVDVLAVRAAYDSQVRQRTITDEPGTIVEVDGPVVRCVAPGTQTSRIEWSALTPENADAVIAGQVRYFAARGAPLEWKLYDYDEPADLAARLTAAGFEPDEDELMLVAETASVGTEVVLPAGVRLVEVTDDAGLDAMLEVHEAAFDGHVSEGLAARLRSQLRDTPDLVRMVVAVAGNEPVSAARVEFLPGTDFAGLWGGGTVPDWRHQGIFRALVAYRAKLAAERGYRYLQVDTSVMSRPILRRLGFEPVAVTTPFLWSPGNRMGEPPRG